MDLTLTLEHLRLTPEERIRKLDSFIADIAKLRASTCSVGPLTRSKQEVNSEGVRKFQPRVRTLGNKRKRARTLKALAKPGFRSLANAFSVCTLC